MKVHKFEDHDLRILASIAIDLHTDHLFFKVIRQYDHENNYWSIDCRFSISEDEINTDYDSLYIDCGSENNPYTYQMKWTTKDGRGFSTRAITSPLVVVHQFEVMCKKEHINLN